MAAQWPKPAEGSWTEHYPELGTGPISFRDSISPEFYAAEQEAIFKRAWLNISRVEETPEPGSYITRQVEAVDAALLLVKDENGRIRAFHNSCRRRGHPVVTIDYRASELRNTGTGFTCRHCGWEYGLDGSLRSVPDPDHFADLDLVDFGLKEVHCDVWAGFVFLNFDENPRQSLREFLDRWSPVSTTIPSTS